MFMAPGLIYVHVPRTGGTFVSSLMESANIGTRSPLSDGTGHESVRELPTGVVGNSLVFSTLRDPWTWYKSLDVHYRTNRSFQGFFYDYFGRSIGFRDVVHGLTRPAEYGRISMDKAVRPPGFRRSVDKFGRQLTTSNIGLYTWMVLSMFCQDAVETIPDVQQYLLQGDAPWSVDAVVDTAQVREGLFAVLHAWNEDVAMRMMQDINSRPVANKGSSHIGVLPSSRPDPAYYDADMQRWVQEADGWAIRRFGFDLPVGKRPMVTLLQR